MDEFEVTPAMLVFARRAFDRWMRRWDFLKDGLPADDDVEQLLRNIILEAHRLGRDPDRVVDRNYLPGVADLGQRGIDNG